MHIVSEEGIHSMSGDPWRKPEDLVGDWADLKTNAAGLHLLHYVWVVFQRETVSDTL